MSELAKYEAIDDGWNDAAEEANARILRGALLKHLDGRWVQGREGEPVEDGFRLIALSCALGWVRWEGGKPVEYRMREPGKPFPEREDLGDDDQTAWEKAPDGTPRDPWALTRLTYLLSEQSAEVFTFSTSSWSGREAVVNLADAIARMRGIYPGAVPVVELRSAPLKTRDGQKFRPVFKITGWRNGGMIETTIEPPKAISPPTLEQETGDKIPF
jgi:hypothetical protein